MGNLPSDNSMDGGCSLGRSIGSRRAYQFIENLSRHRLRRFRRRASDCHILYTYRNGRKLHTRRRNHGNGAGCERVSLQQDRTAARENSRRGKGSVGGAGQGMEPKAPRCRSARRTVRRAASRRVVPTPRTASPPAVRKSPPAPAARAGPRTQRRPLSSGV